MIIGIPTVLFIVMTIVQCLLKEVPSSLKLFPSLKARKRREECKQCMKSKGGRERERETDSKRMRNSWRDSKRG